MNSNCAALCGIPSEQLFFPNLGFVNPPTLDQIQSRGMELIDEINGLLNFESKVATTQCAPQAASYQPSAFVVWLTHVKSCVFGLLSAVTARSTTARLKYFADQRLHRFRLQHTSGIVQPAAVRNILSPRKEFKILACKLYKTYQLFNKIV